MAAGLPRNLSSFSPPALRNSRIWKICGFSRPSVDARPHLQPFKGVRDLHQPGHSRAFFGNAAENGREQRQINRSFRDDADAGAHGFAPAVAPSSPLTHASPSECSKVSRTIFNLP